MNYMCFLIVGTPKPATGWSAKKPRGAAGPKYGNSVIITEFWSSGRA